MTTEEPAHTPPQTGQAERRNQGRSAAEWTTLTISLAVIAALVGLITYLYLSGEGEPAVIEVRPDLASVRHVDGAYYLPVAVTNRGDRTAEDVRVTVTLTGEDGAQESAEVSFRFLAGGETGAATVVFRGDPARGTLASVVSYLNP
jgi:uncharacterized protein (TIGR02588 family)